MAMIIDAGRTIQVASSLSSPGRKRKKGGDGEEKEEENLSSKPRVG